MNFHSNPSPKQEPCCSHQICTSGSMPFIKDYKCIWKSRPAVIQASTIIFNVQFSLDTIFLLQNLHYKHQTTQVLSPTQMIILTNIAKFIFVTMYEAYKAQRQQHYLFLHMGSKFSKSFWNNLPSFSKNIHQFPRKGLYISKERKFKQLTRQRSPSIIEIRYPDSIATCATLFSCVKKVCATPFFPARPVLPILWT